MSDVVTSRGPTQRLPHLDRLEILLTAGVMPVLGLLFLMAGKLAAVRLAARTRENGLRG